MAMHLYMSQEALLLHRQPGPSDLYNYRGECGPGDDPQAFARLMAVKGYNVVIRSTGEPGPITGPTGIVNTDHWRGIPLRNLGRSQ